MGALNFILLNLGFDRNEFAIVGLSNILAIDRSKRQFRRNDIEIDPETSNDENNEQDKSNARSPDCATSNKIFLAGREMASPAKNKRFTIAASLDMRCLSNVFFRFSR